MWRARAARGAGGCPRPLGYPADRPAQACSAAGLVACPADHGRTDEPTAFNLGESFAGILTETTQSLVCVSTGRADPAVQRRLRARDRLHARRGGRQGRARLRDPVRGARRVRRVPDVRLQHRHAEPAGRALADQVGRPAADRVVQPADAGADGDAGALVTTGIDLTDRECPRPGRPRAARATRGEARRGLPAGLRAEGAAPRRDAGRRRGQPGAGLPRRVGGVRAGAAGQLVRGVPLRGRRSATIVGRHNRDSVDVFRHRRGARGQRELRDRARAAHRRARPHRRLGRGATSEIAEAIFRVGYRSSAAAPIVVAGALWGAVAIASEDPLPEDTEDRLGAFCELVSLASRARRRART